MLDNWMGMITTCYLDYSHFIMSMNRQVFPVLSPKWWT
ncbi:uncharacterized protein J3R85_012663 [Psidium guajava]|nr:uncharacterized protein J3R85_012663 [Psidium guajava]